MNINNDFLEALIGILLPFLVWGLALFFLWLSSVVLKDRGQKHAKSCSKENAGEKEKGSVLPTCNGDTKSGKHVWENKPGQGGCEKCCCMNDRFCKRCCRPVGLKGL